LNPIPPAQEADVLPLVNASLILRNKKLKKLTLGAEEQRLKAETIDKAKRSNI